MVALLFVKRGHLSCIVQVTKSMHLCSRCQSIRWQRLFFLNQQNRDHAIAVTSHDCIAGLPSSFLAFQAILNNSKNSNLKI